jgi:hypothetical protein
MMGRLAGGLGPRLPLTWGSLIVGLGFLLALRFAGSYWTDLFPAILVIALGLSGAVAPLTAAVLDSVDARHTAAASGFNSAVARAGGLVATALLGTVLAAHGPALLEAFHGAMITGAAACALAALSAFALLAPTHGPNGGGVSGRH